ncbi:hypothetical protein [Erythrobacter litoralis]|uniref:Uncharacterized protein n=1 Tax=Erythrobacter litoralis (strain HTCC2594) TaxID=314225 RepID=Q2N9Z1_ERYLH|nr:hypothetical protein [Erythrobacter litoralis]ABC63500.1 hypothetical protein ELI_07040 [Erythrobacter litoralis HTCC2594]
MENTWVRLILATLAGLIAAVFIVGAVESAGHMIFPPPEGLDMTKPEDQARLMEVIPTGAKVTVVVAWFLGSLCGAAVATLVGKTITPGWIVAGFMVLASIFTTQMFPHPTWMVVAAIFVPVMGKLLADQLLKSRLSS